MSRLLHLNGPPGIGTSTLARRYAADDPGVLVCDIDVLRTFLGGWQDDFAAAGHSSTTTVACARSTPRWSPASRATSRRRTPPS